MVPRESGDGRLPLPKQEIYVWLAAYQQVDDPWLRVSLRELLSDAEREQYWTSFKEAYIKARGMGLSLPLDRFCFHFHGEQAVSFTAAAEIDGDPGCWLFWQCRPPPDYLLALCAESHGGQPPLSSVRRFGPAAVESLLPVAWLKSSAAARASLAGRPTASLCWPSPTR